MLPPEDKFAYVNIGRHARLNQITTLVISSVIVFTMTTSHVMHNVLNNYEYNHICNCKNHVLM